MSHSDGCPLCGLDPAEALWFDAHCLVVRAEIPGIGHFCRVVWRAHVQEMTDLNRLEQHHLLDVVLAVETVLRAALRPTKMNIASLGNQVPHLHWHVIPRFFDDPFFPDSVWTAPHRAPRGRETLSEDALRVRLHEMLRLLPKLPL
ncbi:MAG TPA: HIT family protein [Acidiferrobacter sp.]|nr:HIT family protein [Acidiferrobacter sp.]